MLIAKAKFKNIREMKTGVRLGIFVAAEDANHDVMINVVQALGTKGFVLFAPDKIKQEVEDYMKNKSIGINEEGKSPSELLRGNLFLLWHEKHSKEIAFEDYYKKKMDGLIKMVKDSIAGIEAERIEKFYFEKLGDKLE